mmetsp:Transcript_18088/g.44906  ORF Transcript_18088/g.44906 Transcript_18088/m.44906 type:complete len:305 (+) Transcript_18088:1900-2814(+)
MYGVLRNLAFMLNRSMSMVSTTSSHPSPISVSCSDSLSSAATNPARGEPIGYFSRVMRFTRVASSKAPSRKYPNARRFWAKLRTTASMSGTSSPKPSGVNTTVPLGSVVLDGKKCSTGETRSTHSEVLDASSYFSWQNSAYLGAESTRVSISFMKRRDAALNTDPPVLLSNWNDRVPLSDSLWRMSVPAPVVYRSTCLMAASAASQSCVTGSFRITHSLSESSTMNVARLAATTTPVMSSTTPSTQPNAVTGRSWLQRLYRASSPRRFTAGGGTASAASVALPTFILLSLELLFLCGGCASGVC